jgi:hypothetical protein
MNKKNQEINDDPLAPLIATIRNSLRDELLAVIRSEIRATSAEERPDRVMLSIAEIGRRYGYGRIAMRRLIASGKLPAVTRPCRGGRQGSFVHLADAERFFAGRVQQ